MEDKVKLTVESAVRKPDTSNGGQYFVTIKCEEFAKPLVLRGFPRPIRMLDVSRVYFQKEKGSSTYLMFVTFKNLPGYVFFIRDFPTDKYVLTGKIPLTIE